MKDETCHENNLTKPAKECSICGDIARGLNFSVMTCISCKNFFRRNAYRQSSVPSCQFENDCIITKRTRSYCTSCRLKKCLSLGMDPQLIRIIPGSTIISRKSKLLKTVNNKQSHLPMPLPLNLLQNDRSTLTSGEWTLMSNFIHNFDARIPITGFQSTLKQLLSLPPKLRSKPSELLKLICEILISIGPFIENTPDFSSLTDDDRRAFAKHNMYTVGSIAGYFICREVNAFDNVAFSTACLQCYGPEYVANCCRFIARTDPNTNLIKVLLFILAFSSNCSVVKYKDHENISIMSSSINLVRLQNIYVTVLWKYLLYLYGYSGAVLRFSSLIKNVLDALNMLGSIPDAEIRHRMIDTIIIETERKLVIDD